MKEPNLAAKIRSVETIAEMDALVAALDAVAPIGGDVRSMIALRRIELQMEAQKVRK